MPDNNTPEQLFSSLTEITLDVILLIALTVGVAWLAVFLVQRLFPMLAEAAPSRFRLSILPLVPLLRLIILLSAAIVIANLLTDNVWAVLGAAVLAIGFAFRDYASGLIGGIVTVYERPYRRGDRITIGGDYGEVRSVGLRAAQIVTPDDTVVTIPHNRMWTENIHNANDGRRGHLCVADFYLHPEHDAAQVRLGFHAVILTSPYTDLTRPVTVILRERPWGTHYRLKAYPVDGRDEFEYISDLTVRGKETLSELGARLAVAGAVAGMGPV
ncbi:MAG: mechanosensitive ion channel [Caldilineaceae bacterium]|nr:mechanosensitive ion channel [Caldilineaceae bacterium]